MRISSKNGAKTTKNKSFDNQSVISSDYIFLKNGGVKRKRIKNSYFETFLEKRRMAAEFAQSKRCYSTISTKIQKINKNNENKNKPNNQLSYQGLQEIINMNNLKHNLPGKATPIIDNTSVIFKANGENHIAEQEDNHEINLDKINTCFSQNNINMPKKNQNNDELNQPYFDEIRHLTNKSNANNEINNNLIPPYELENDNNEETSKFGNEGKIIDTNKSRKIEMIPEKHFEIIHKNKYDKLKSSINTYIKKRPIRDDNNQISTLLQSKNHKINSTETNPVNISISFRNDFNKNADNNSNKINTKNKKNYYNNNKEIIYSNDLNIKYNENKNNDMNRYVETNNNEENYSNINFFQNNEKNININNNIDINNKDIKENNNLDVININNITNKTNNTIDTCTQNDVSNDIIEETNVIKENEGNLNEKKNQIKIEDNIKNVEKIYINIDNLKPPFKTIEEVNRASKIKGRNQNETDAIKKTIDNLTKPEENKSLINSKNSINKNEKIFKNYEKVNLSNIYLRNNTNLNNNQNNSINLKPPSVRNKNSKKIEKNNNQNYYSLMISKDIEKLNKLKQSSQRNKEPNYFNELNDFIDNIKKKRDNQNNEYINLTNENREKLMDLQNQKKDLQLFQNQIHNALNYNKNKISFHSTKNFNSHQNNINYNYNINNNKKKNDFKVKISSRMQGLLNKLEKEKISNNIDRNDDSNININIEDNNNNINNNKRIFTQNVINSINSFIETENNGIITNNQINHINNINNNNHNNNFILLQNYYNNESNYINNRKNKKTKKNYFNYVSFEEYKKRNDKNIISDREYKNYNNRIIKLDKDNINALDGKIYKLIKTKNNRNSKSKPNLEINLDANKKRISFLDGDKYKILNNQSKRFDKSIDFLEGHYFFDKLNDINKNNDIDLFRAKNKKNWNSLNLFGINNKIGINNNSGFKIMPVNNIKSLF